MPRLQKVLAAAGLGSRRQCEQLIVEGRVEVDRRVVAELGARVNPLQQEIRVDGEPLTRPKLQYFMLNKPSGVVSTSRDPSGRPRVIDLIKSHQRLFPVGRLDLASEGLILLTNDGELANLLTHPRYEVEKTYLALVAGVPTPDQLAQLERGVHLAEGYAHAKRVRIKSQHKHSAVLEVVLDEGRNREVRRLLARTGHKVLRLKRIAVGTLRLGDLGPGEYRPLRPDEVRKLKDEALDDSKNQHPPRRREVSGISTANLAAHSSSPGEVRGPENKDAPLSPRHKGTIIGGDDDLSVGKSAKTPPKRPAAPRSGRIMKVTPLIDVRRGIFPGSARGSATDFDDDDAPAAGGLSKTDFNSGDSSKRQHRGKRAGPWHKPARQEQRQGAKKPGQKRRAGKQPRRIDSQSKPVNPRKGRRR